MTPKSVYRGTNFAILINGFNAFAWSNNVISLIFIGIVLFMIGFKIYCKQADKKLTVCVFD